MKKVFTDIFHGHLAHVELGMTYKHFLFSHIINLDFTFPKTSDRKFEKVFISDSSKFQKLFEILKLNTDSNNYRNFFLVNTFLNINIITLNK